jgi:hypothetical protein
MFLCIMAAIEDVDYLWENSEKQSFLVYIDSSQRNRRVFPHPNNYVVEFDKPFRFVYGYDILDAMIPTTAYNVERHNNTLILGQILSTRPGWQTEQFNTNAFLKEFDFVPAVSARLLDASPGSLWLVPRRNLDDFGIAYTQRPENVDDVAVMCTQNDVVAMSNREPPYDTPVTTRDNAAWYVASDDAVLLQGPHHLRFGARNPHAGSVSLRIAAIRYVSTMDHATIDQTLLYDVCIRVSAVTLTIMQYDSRQLQQMLNRQLSNLDMSCAHASAVPEQANKYAWTGRWPFWFNMQTSTCASTLGFDELSTPAGAAGVYQGLGDALDADMRMFVSVFQAESQQQALVSPGMLDMGGVPYVMFRVAELEEHAFAGDGNNSSTINGLGIFKLLAGSNGISNMRFDFTNLVRRPFHPIGKLCRLSIRMEQSDGTLYDFKGINHNILLVLKYLVPSVKSAVPRYNIRMLNADYEPDAQKYLIARRRLIDDLDDEVDDDAGEELSDLLERAEDPPAAERDHAGLSLSWKQSYAPTLHSIKQIVQKYAQSF